MKIFDISRPIAAGEPIYPGNPSVKLARLKTFARDKSVLSALAFGLHTASHLDAPMHYVKNGASVERVALSECMGWARLIDCKKTAGEIPEKLIARARLKRGEIILFKTKNSRPAKRFRKDFTYLGEAGAKLLVRARVKGVGIDGPSIRKFRLKPDAVHPTLLKAKISIYEGLQFDQIPSGRYYFIGLPLRIVGGEGSPVRAVLIQDK